MRAIALSLTLSGLLLAAAPARAEDPEQAKVFFDSGLKLMEEGHAGRACAFIAESYRLAERPGTLFTLAECEARRGHVATAVARYREYLALFATLPPDKRQKQGTREGDAHAQIEALEPKIPHLVLEPAPDPSSGADVRLDGVALPRPWKTMDVPLDPGEHFLSAQVPPDLPRGRVLRIQVGERKIVSIDARQMTDLAPAPAPAPPPAEAAPGQRNEPMRVAAIVVSSLGLAGLVVAAVAAGAAPFDTRGLTGCSGPCPTGSGFDPLIMAGTGLGVGLVALSVGAGLFVRSEEGRADSAVSVRRIEIGALLGGPRGTLLGARFTW